MNRKRTKWIRGLAGLVLGTAGVALADGPPIDGGEASVERYTIDAGGGPVAGGIYEVHGSIGQKDAGPVLSGGAFDLQGGFWAGSSNPRGTVYRDSFEG